jgi:hypothetical protein
MAGVAAAGGTQLNPCFLERLGLRLQFVQEPIIFRVPC